MACWTPRMVGKGKHTPYLRLLTLRVSSARMLVAQRIRHHRAAFEFHQWLSLVVSKLSMFERAGAQAVSEATMRCAEFCGRVLADCDGMNRNLHLAQNFI